MSVVAAAESTRKAIRRLPEDEQCPSAVDFIKALIGVKNARQAWKAVKDRNPAIMEHVQSRKERGGTVDYLSKEAVKMLIADLRTNKAQGQEALEKLLKSALDLVQRFYGGDGQLIQEISDQTDDPEVLAHITHRAQTKLTQRVLTDACKAAGASGHVYPAPGILFLQ